MPPPDFLAAGRAEVNRYGVEVIEDRVVGITTGFSVRLAGGTALDARRILVATGMRDVLPDIPGVRERWGRDLVHCPYCHGWEVRDQPIGVLGTRPDAVQHALLVRQWSDDVVFFVHTLDMGSDDLGRLKARGVLGAEPSPSGDGGTKPASAPRNARVATSSASKKTTAPRPLISPISAPRSTHLRRYSAERNPKPTKTPKP